MFNANGKEIFERYALEAFLGESIADFDIDAIIEEATEINPKDGNRYWRDGIDLAEIVARHDLTE